MLRFVSLLLSLVFSLSAKHVLGQFQAAPQEYEINVEGGADFRGFRKLGELQQAIETPPASWNQSSFSPSAAFSFYLRIPNLRAYYGPRLEGHFTNWDSGAKEGTAYSAAALFGYRAFLFDMEGDCDCPRWDKTNFFKKAFFLEFAAGYGRQSISADGDEATYSRGGAAYLARLGFAVRLKKQIDVYLAGGGHGLIAADQGYGRHELAVRPSLGLTWRPYYNRF